LQAKSNPELLARPVWNDEGIANHKMNNWFFFLFLLLSSWEKKNPNFWC